MVFLSFFNLLQIGLWLIRSNPNLFFHFQTERNYKSARRSGLKEEVKPTAAHGVLLLTNFPQLCMDNSGVYTAEICTLIDQTV